MTFNFDSNSNTSYGTIIYLPIKESVKLIYQSFFEEIDYAIIYLRKLVKTEIEINTDSFIGKKTVFKSKDDIDNILKIEIRVEEINKLKELIKKETIKKYKLFSHSDLVPDDFIEKNNSVKRNKYSNIVLAFPYSNNSTPEEILKEKYYLSSYLPIRQIPINLFIQADFDLITNREDIDNSNSWNIW